MWKSEEAQFLELQVQQAISRNLGVGLFDFIISTW